MELRACHYGFAEPSKRSYGRHANRELQALRTTVACAKGQEICSPDALNAYWWQVESGAVRKVLLLPSGQRCIMEFFLPGDLFVCNASDRDDVLVEALCDGTILGRYNRDEVERLARQDGSIARMLREANLREAFHMEAHILNLWHQRSTDKVLAFLAQIQRRQRQTPNGFVSLPMSRNDIADYLGLSVETVSRALTELKQRGILEFGGTRQLKIARPSDSLLSLPLYADSNHLMTGA